MSEAKVNGADPNVIHVGMKAEDGKVVLVFDRPIQNWVIDPKNAFEIADGMEKAAYAALGKAPNDDYNYLAKKGAKKVTDAIRDRMVSAATFNLAKMLEAGHKPDYMAAELIDRVLSEVA